MTDIFVKKKRAAYRLFKIAGRQEWPINLKHSNQFLLYRALNFPQLPDSTNQHRRGNNIRCGEVVPLLSCAISSIVTFRQWCWKPAIAST